MEITRVNCIYTIKVIFLDCTIYVIYRNLQRLHDNIEYFCTVNEEPTQTALIHRLMLAFMFDCDKLLFSLTLKTPRKPASENVICLCHLLNILANFSNLFLYTSKQCGARSDFS